jgi:hypothetical protein
MMSLMTEAHKHRLIKNRVQLVRNVQNIAALLDVLREDYSVTEDMQNEIQDCKTRDQQVGRLLDILSRRPDKSFNRFIYALVQTDQDPLANLLDPQTAQRMIIERDHRRNHGSLMSSSHGNMSPSLVYAAQSSPHGMLPNVAQVGMFIPGVPQSSSNVWVPMAGFQQPGMMSLPANNLSLHGYSNGPVFRMSEPVQETSGMVAAAGVPLMQPTTDGLNQMVQDFKQAIERLDNAAMDCTIRPATDLKTNELIYPMKRKPRGHTVIISNTYFLTPRLQERAGSLIDVDNIWRLFTNLSFEVTVHTNKTAVEMLELLTAERASSQHFASDAFVLFLLTHGSQGHVFGTDGEKLEVDTITSLFDGHNCPALRGKPKLFFIQACQGKLRSSRFQHDGPFQEYSDSKLASCSQEEVEKKFAELTVEDMPGYVPPLNNVHEKADMLISYATVKGYEAWRHQELGSWFVRSLVYVFTRRAHYMHLVDMLTEANFLMSHLETQGLAKPYRQVAEKRDTFCRHLYFLPGYHSMA